MLEKMGLSKFGHPADGSAELSYESQGNKVSATVGIVSH